MTALLSVLLLALSGCGGGGGGGGGGPGPPVAARIELDRAVVFLTEIGQSAPLGAVVEDASGASLTAAVLWTSSAPDQVGVDSSGRVLAKEIGSALVYAEADGVRSAPVFVVVAEPAPGALLVADEQVVSIGAPAGLAAGEAPAAGSRYEVRLTGLTPASAPGAILLPSGTAALAGRVVDAREEAGVHVVTLEVVPLAELLARYRISWEVDLGPYLEGVPAPAGARTAAPGSPAVVAAAAGAGDGPTWLAPFRALDCDGSLDATFVETDVSLQPGVTLKLLVDEERLDPEGPVTHSKRAVTGGVTLQGNLLARLKAGFEASGTCWAQVPVDLPVLGILSAIVMPGLRLGVGVELAGVVEVATGEIGVTGKLGITTTLGFECGGAFSGCQALDQVALVNEFKPALSFPSVNDKHVKLSAHFFALLGLDAVFATLVHAPMLEARYGPKQSGDFGFEDDQAMNAGYASTYDLAKVGTLKPAGGLKAAIELLAPTGSSVSFQVGTTEPVSWSPRGTFTVSKARAAPGEGVQVSVELDPTTLEYWQLGYNVVSVDIWRRKESEVEFSNLHSILPSTSGGRQSRFDWVWEPGGEDIGKNELAAFVVTTLPILPALEVAPQSVREVEIGCFTSGATIGALALADGGFCADRWMGTASTWVTGVQTVDASVTWVRDLTYVSQGAEVRYEPEGTVTVGSPLFTDQGCTVEPHVFSAKQVARGNWMYVDYAQTPPTYTAAGDVGDWITISCPDADPIVTPASYTYILASGTIEDDGTIRGSGSTPGVGGYAYSFARP